MKLMRRFLRWSAVVVGVWLFFCMAIGVVATEWALHPWRRELGPKEEALAQAVAARNHAVLAEVAVTASDGAILRGWSIRPLHGNGDAVILLHGVADNRMGMIGYADLLLRRGYAVLLPDARRHGASGGDLATYGIMEAGDVRRWYDWIKEAERPRCIDGLGNSMGAAQLLQSLRTTPGFCAVVAESPFANFREASYDRLAERLGAGAWLGRTVLRPVVETGVLYARWKYKVDLEQASPENAVAASKVPVLLIHGLKDTNLPPRHSELIVAHSSSRKPAVVLWEPVEAKHTGAAAAEPQEYERRLIGWFESHDAAGHEDREDKARSGWLNAEWNGLVPVVEESHEWAFNEQVASYADSCAGDDSDEHADISAGVSERKPNSAGDVHRRNCAEINGVRRITEKDHQARGHGAHRRRPENYATDDQRRGQSPNRNTQPTILGCKNRSRFAGHAVASKDSRS
jgi:uncharacterized protein